MAAVNGGRALSGARIDDLAGDGRKRDTLLKLPAPGLPLHGIFRDEAIDDREVCVLGNSASLRGEHIRTVG